MPDLTLTTGTHNTSSAAVVTSLSLANNANENADGKIFTQTTANVGNLPLTGYTPITSGNLTIPSSSDNINTAIAKIMHILGNDTSLTTGEPEETTDVLTKVSLQNGALIGTYETLGSAAYSNTDAFETAGTAENVRKQLIGKDTDDAQTGIYGYGSGI
jgi:hypothetical protein